MTEAEHYYWAKEAVKALVARIRDFEGGSKPLTYGALAAKIGYPVPHSGNLFGANIGYTLGQMGHMFDDMEVGGQRVPMLQTMVVSSSNKLPSDGLKEFVPGYPTLSTDKKRDLANQEYGRIFEFGDRWMEVMNRLGLLPENISLDEQSGPKLFNPWGSEGSPEHRRLREHVYDHPERFGLTYVLRKVQEYPLKSGDAVDVVFETSDCVVGVEVKSARSGLDDLQRGLFQTIKYSAVLCAEELLSGKPRAVQSLLVLESELPRELWRMRKALDVQVIDSFYDKT